MQQPRSTSSSPDCTLLAMNLRVALGQLNRRLRVENRPTDLTHSQTSVLLLLEREGPTTMSALARAEGIRPQSMGPIVSALRDAGLVQAAADRTDARKTSLSLTPYARELFATGRMARENWLLHRIRTQLSEDDQRDLVRCIALLQQLSNPADH